MRYQLPAFCFDASDKYIRFGKRVRAGLFGEKKRRDVGTFDVIQTLAR